MQRPNQREWYLKNRDSVLEKNKTLRAQDPEKYKQRGREYYQKHHESRLAKNREYRHAHPEIIREHDRQKYERFRERIKERVGKRTWAVRWAALTHYGGDPPRCACCGEDNYFFLGFDHINNDGAKFRRENGSGAIHLAYWLTKNNYPEGIQILCHNCNFAKGHYGGFCPHMIDVLEVVD